MGEMLREIELLPAKAQDTILNIFLQLKTKNAGGGRGGG